MTKKSIKQPIDIVIYQTPSGELQFRGDIQHETIWATQAQIAEVFGIERSVITKHIRNIYKESELSEKATCAKIAQVQKEGKREVLRTIEHYNLDMIISVGYRVNSKMATGFRQWATSAVAHGHLSGFFVKQK